ncbi:MAG: radical SAM protein [Candidatus Omnitrophota bacterium]
MPFQNKLRRFSYKFLKQPGYALNVLRRRGLGYLSYYFGRGRSFLPESLTIFLTQRCNLHCHMCGQWGRHGVSLKAENASLQEELSFEELSAIIKEVSSFKPNITLFGGEPLLYKDGCIRLIDYIKKNKLHCLMITNGSLLKENAESLVLSGLDELNISLDGPAGLHDKIRGQEGLFKKIVSGVERINYFKMKYSRRAPLVGLQSTLNSDNYRYLDKLLPVARELKVDSLTFHNLIFINEEMLKEQKRQDLLLKTDSKGWEGFLFNPGIDIAILQEKLNDVFASAKGLNIDLYPNLSPLSLKEYYDNPQRVPTGFLARCISPWIVAYILCDGQVKPCLNFSYSFGNIKEASFVDIWNSEPAINFRKQLKANKIFSVCPKCTELYRY